MWSSFSIMGHLDVKWSIVSSYFFHNRHLLSIICLKCFTFKQSVLTEWSWHGITVPSDRPFMSPNFVPFWSCQLPEIAFWVCTIYESPHDLYLWPLLSSYSISSLTSALQIPSKYNKPLALLWGRTHVQYLLWGDDVREWIATFLFLYPGFCYFPYF
jgi:hypothetical protein